MTPEFEVELAQKAIKVAEVSDPVSSPEEGWGKPPPFRGRFRIVPWASEDVKKLKKGDFNPCHPIENPRRGTPWRARTTIFSHLLMPVKGHGGDGHGTPLLGRPAFGQVRSADLEAGKC